MRLDQLRETDDPFEEKSEQSDNHNTLDRIKQLHLLQRYTSEQTTRLQRSALAMRKKLGITVLGVVGELPQPKGNASTQVVTVPRLTPHDAYDDPPTYPYVWATIVGTPEQAEAVAKQYSDFIVSKREQMQHYTKLWIDAAPLSFELTNRHHQ
jgi:hypothetical protein